MHTPSTDTTRKRVLYVQHYVAATCCLGRVANEISQKNSEDIRVCLRENRRRELRTYLLRSETQLLSLDRPEAMERRKWRSMVVSQESCEGRALGR